MNKNIYIFLFIEQFSTEIISILLTELYVQNNILFLYKYKNKIKNFSFDIIWYFIFYINH